ncbi:MAG: MBOAT family protein, partial [Bacteroidia bacterium]|nr:MBOAT family protein [Bacteroidia bacterium]
MCWKSAYIILIATSTLVDYFAGIYIHQSKTKSRRKLLLYLSLFVNLGLLFVFKYLDFFNDTIGSVFNQFNIFYDVPAYNFLLPVGISFYTFQTLSYTIDVYKGRIEPERHLGRFALYVSFFPQLVAGPIERATRLLPQFKKVHTFDYNRVKNGLLLILWGLFKKVVIADRVSEYVNTVYNNPGMYSGLQSILATYFFAFQIYCDFSGYSDIAIGAALVLGYELIVNFKRPYFSRTFKEVFNRWHISLYNWFRDYVYVPLGLKFRSKFFRQAILVLVFLLTGLWHGAEWTFVLWGGLCALIIVLGTLTQKLRNNLFDRAGIKRSNKFRIIYDVVITFHFCFLVFIMFRAQSVSHFVDMVASMFHIDFASQFTNINLFLVPADMAIGVVGILFLLGIELLQEKYGSKKLFYSMVPRWGRWTFVGMIIMSIILFGKFDNV